MNEPGHRALWLTCALIFSIIVGVAGGVLAFLAGDNAARAIISGGATFGGTTALLIVILNFLASPKK